MAGAFVSTAQVAGDRLLTVRKEADAAGAPEWSALARLTFLEAQIKRFGVHRSLHPGSKPPDEGRELLATSIEEAKGLMEQLAVLDMTFQAFRAKRLQGNAYVMLEDMESAKAVHEELVVWAKHIGLTPDAATLMDPPPTGIDEHALAKRLVEADPESFGPMEDDIIRRLGLPADRKPVLHQESLLMQVVARERLTWCRHLALLQDLAHRQKRETSYARPPRRAGHCTLLGYESVVRETDGPAMIAAFKSAYCNSCDRRDPFEA